MVCATLFIAILTVASGAAPLYCSDVQSPASGSGHNTDLSQVTTLQYCIIDNCTIMRIDTGQQLDIVYTTESLLIVTPKDGHTSMMIIKIDDQLSCSTLKITADDNTVQLVWSLATTLLIMILSGLILFVYLLFKELHHLLGQLLMLYNIGWIFLCITILIQMLLHYRVAVNSQMICHAMKLLIMIGTLNLESLTLCMFTHLVYVVYVTCKLRKVSKRKVKYLRKCYTAYVLCMLGVFLCVALIYDIVTDSGRVTLQPDGLCSPYMQKSYNTQFIINIFVGINKVLQMVLLSLYFVHFYKLYKLQGGLDSSVFSSSRHNQELFKIALAMALSVITSQFFYLLGAVIGSQIDSINGILLILNQLVILAYLLCTKKRARPCKDLLCQNRIVPQFN